ncbi:MAG TPA: hypothetical protein VI854_03445, partial [Acidimicrobiia bacterium]|nr:hypothetical protein [Acidimicrobiia bacterium]
MPPFLLPAEPVTSLDAYLAGDVGGLGLAKAVALGSAGTIEEVRRSGLRGRGGAGFPTARKWEGVLGEGGTHRYLVVNAAEGEPGTFKDRALMRANPYQLVEGALIAAYAVGVVEVFIGLKASFRQEIEAVTRAVEELQGAGICQDFTVTIAAGPDEYLYGEESAMLEVIEGKDPLPRLLRPYQHGLFATMPQEGWSAAPEQGGHRPGHESNPTLVNNVETLSNLPWILTKGADWFRTMGTEDSPGTVVCTVLGDVAHAGVAEVELGTPLADVIRTVGGGVAAGRA